MTFTDILSFCFSILGLYGLLHYLRLLIPRNVLPRVAAVLAETEHLLDRALHSQMTIGRPSHRTKLSRILQCHMSLQKKTNSFVVPIMLARYVWCMKAIITSLGSS